MDSSMPCAFSQGRPESGMNRVVLVFPWGPLVVELSAHPLPFHTVVCRLPEQLSALLRALPGACCMLELRALTVTGGRKTGHLLSTGLLDASACLPSFGLLCSSLSLYPQLTGAACGPKLVHELFYLTRCFTCSKFSFELNSNI